jgi:quercetin 2,3-dioxygenase
MEKVFGTPFAARLEDQITGRVCPNFFEYSETSPFVMLVHHCHSFSVLDPVRWIQKTFFPEGFPAHPHRGVSRFLFVVLCCLGLACLAVGQFLFCVESVKLSLTPSAIPFSLFASGFITVTYILDGGFVHRDSEGCMQQYGGSQAELGKGKHTQWLNTGSGMLHEEMFANDSNYVRQELYQLWLNVPANQKWTEPKSVLLGGPDETPLVVGDESRTLVLAGSFDGAIGAAPVVSDVSLLHVQISPQGEWIYRIPAQYETLIIYVRKGSGLSCVAPSGEEPTSIPVHHIAYMNASGQDLVLQNSDSADIADFLVLAGVPLREPCFASGSMVMSNPQEINQAYADYQAGLFGTPWDHKLSDEEWRQHVQATSPKRQ